MTMTSLDHLHFKNEDMEHHSKLGGCGLCIYDLVPCLILSKGFAVHKTHNLLQFWFSGEKLLLYLQRHWEQLQCGSGQVRITKPNLRDAYLHIATGQLCIETKLRYKNDIALQAVHRSPTSS